MGVQEVTSKSLGFGWDDFGLGRFQQKITLGFFWVGEFHVFPVRALNWASAVELEEAGEGAQRESDEPQEAASVHAQSHVHAAFFEIDGPVTGEVEGFGRGLEILGAEDSVLDVKGAEGVAGGLDADGFVVENAADEWGERAEHGDGE
jgi:hypothetical protein